MRYVKKASEAVFEPPYMSPKQFAAYMKIHIMTVYKHITTGRIKAFRVGGQWRIEPKMHENYGA